MCARAGPYGVALEPHPEWTRYYLYVLIDIFSRYVVGWMVADRENSSLACQLIQGTCLKQDVQPKTLTLRSDDE